MKTVILGIILLLLSALFLTDDSPYAYGQTQRKEGLSSQNIERAEKFFESCKERPVIKIDAATDEAFCACAAMHLQSWLSTQKEDSNQFGLLDTGSEPEELEEDVLMIDVYGPCLFIPMYEITYDECYNSTRFRYFLNSKRRLQGMCGCLAEGESLYFENFAQPFLDLKIRAEGQEIIDPVKAIKFDTNYYDAHSTLEDSCFKKWTAEQ